MNMQLLNVLAIVIVAGNIIAQESPVLKTEQDKINYGFGLGVARNFTNQGVGVNLELVMRAKLDTLSGGTLLMTEEDLAKTIFAFQQELR